MGHVGEYAGVGAEGAEVGAEGAEVGAEGAEVGAEGAEVGAEGAEVGAEGAEVGEADERVDAGETSVGERVFAGEGVILIRWAGLFFALKENPLIGKAKAKSASSNLIKELRRIVLVTVVD